jgi:hypothetical protein
MAERGSDLEDVLEGLLARRMEPSGWAHTRQYLAELEAALNERNREAVESSRGNLEAVGRTRVAASWRAGQRPAAERSTGRPLATPAPPDVKDLINRMRDTVLSLKPERPEAKQR